MPTNFPGVPANGYPVNIPSPNNADVGDATYLLAMASAAADRTAWLKNFIDTLMPGGELRGLTKLPNLAFLRSYAGAGGTRVEGDIVLVVGVGIYGWVSAATDDPVDPAIVTPTAVGSGAGRWYLLVAAAPLVPKGLVGQYRATNTAGVYIPLGDETLNTVSVPVKANDVLIVTGTTVLGVAPSGTAQGEHRIFLAGVVQLAKTSFAMANASATINVYASHDVRLVLPVPLDDDGQVYSLSQVIHCAGGAVTVTSDNSLLTVEQYRF